MKSEKQGRPIFYGSMITEGIVALIWATVSSYFFFYGGWKEVVSPDVVQQFVAQSHGAAPKTLIQFFDAPTVVKDVCNGWLGVFGGILALLGVVAAPITSGDTAFRSARLIVAEFLNVEQKTIRKRLYICLPMFAVSVLLLIWQMENPDGFNVIWQYFGWANQTLSVFTLWTITVYLVQQKKPFIITLIPALFMTVVCGTFLFVSKQAFGFSQNIGYCIAGVIIVAALVWFFAWMRKYKSTVDINN
jgi:carbon starvation protein CstA